MDRKNQKAMKDYRAAISNLYSGPSELKEENGKMPEKRSKLNNSSTFMDLEIEDEDLIDSPKQSQGTGMQKKESKKGGKKSKK